MSDYTEQHSQPPWSEKQAAQRQGDYWKGWEEGFESAQTEAFADQRQGGEAVARLLHWKGKDGFAPSVCARTFAELSYSEDGHKYWREGERLYTAPQPAVPEGYAGVKMWIGDREVTKIVPEHVVNYELESGSAITFAAQSCLNQLAERPEPPEDT